MESTRWFARVEMDSAPEAARSVLAELIVMLDATLPSALDPARSHALDSGHGWAADVEIKLAHAETPEYDVELTIDADEATLFWMGIHEHIYADDGTVDRPWPLVVVDAVAAIIRGEYTVERTLRWGRVIRARLLDDVTGRRLSETGNLFGLIPGPTKTERVSVDFRCRA
jgi:hypothetical protein